MKKKIKISNGVKPKYIIGIDEVGRGPLAGPVTVAAVAVTANYKLQKPNSKLRDLTPPDLASRQPYHYYLQIMA